MCVRVRAFVRVNDLRVCYNARSSEEDGEIDRRGGGGRGYREKRHRAKIGWDSERVGCSIIRETASSADKFAQFCTIQAVGQHTEIMSIVRQSGIL